MVEGLEPGFTSSIYEHTDDGVFLTAPSGRILAVNPAGCRMLGMSEERIREVGRAGVLDASDPRLSDFLRDRNEKGRARGVLRFIRGDGTRFDAETTSVVYHDADGEERTALIMRDFTERKRLEMEREQYYKFFMLSMDPMCIADPFGCFLHVNPAFCELTGYKTVELVSKPFLDFVIPEDRQRTADEMKLQVAERPSLRFENTYVCKDGHHVLLLWNAYYDKTDGVTYATARDVTERRAAQRRLAESEARYRSVVNSMAEGVVFQAADGSILSVNPAAERIEGRTLEEMLGHDSADPMWAATREDGSPFPGEDHPSMATLRSGEPQSNVVMGITRGDGEKRWISINSALVQPEGAVGPRAVVTTFHDITERKKSEQKIRDYAARMEHTMVSIVDTISLMVELRDPYTAGHERRVAHLAVAIGRELGLDDDRLLGLQMSAAVHDVGKLSVPGDLLVKPSRLSPIEFEMVRTHAQNGYEVLKNIDSPWPFAEVARQHHERMNGTGYPRGLRGDEILMEARILAVADTVEAMSSHRPYRPALGIDVSLQEIERGSGTLFDPAVVSACTQLFRGKGYKLPDV
jgi:PAS domain S-box-containing protein